MKFEEYLEKRGHKKKCKKCGRMMADHRDRLDCGHCDYTVFSTDAEELNTVINSETEEN